MAKGKMTQNIKIERLGTLQEWVLRAARFSEHQNLRRGYERGFHQRTEDFNQGICREDVEAPIESKCATVGDAWALGYADALKQEQPA